MNEIPSSFFRSTLQSTKDEAELKILNLRNGARERLRSIHNRPCDASPDAILNEIAVVARMLLDITVELKATCSTHRFSFRIWRRIDRKATSFSFAALPVPTSWVSPYARMKVVNDSPPHHTIKRRSDEPKLQIGERVSIKEGVIGIVIARYTPSGGHNEVRYVVEELPDEGEKRGKPLRA